MIISGNKYYKNNQIVVPKEIRDKQKLNNLDPDDIVVDWITKGNEIKIKFRKKKETWRIRRSCESGLWN